MLNKVLVYTPQQLSTSQRDTACSNIGALRNHGNASVEELNALTDKLVGSLYTLTDGGQLNSFGSSVPVSAGDMVMLTEEGWRRISSGSGSGGLADIYHDDTMSGDGKSEETKLSVNEMEGPVVMSYDPAVLGGVEYEGHKVGEQLWTCALSYEVGSASWYNDNKATYEKYGMYYKFSDVPLIQAQLSDGWRVPTDEDFKKLVQFVGGSNGKKLISAEDGGTDDYGLGWRLGGYNSEWAGQRGRYRSSDSGNTGMVISGLDVYYNDNNSETTPTNIVLVKDIVTDRDGKKGLVPKPFISDAKRVLSGSGQWVDLPSKISQLENDAGYEKLVISNTPPAPGTPMDVITAVLGNHGGGGEGGAWELIGEGSAATGTSYTFSKSLEEFDFLLVVAYRKESPWNRQISCYTAVNSLSFSATNPDVLRVNVDDNTELRAVTFNVLSRTNIVVGGNGTNGRYSLVKFYGVSLRSKENVYSTEERAIGKWIDGKTIYRRVILSPVLVSIRDWITILTESSIKNVLKAGVISSYNGADQLYCAPMWCRVYEGNIQVNGAGLTAANIGDPITIEYTKNEG